MMATVLRKVKLGNKNKSETVTQNGTWETEERNDRRRVIPSGETFVQCGRVCGLVKVCTGPADSMGSRRRRNRPHGRGNPQSHLTLFQSLQLRIDLWTSTTGHLLDRSFTRKFCHRKSENELYRSNSFRFEKFDKQEEDLAQQSSTRLVAIFFCLIQVQERYLELLWSSAIWKPKLILNNMATLHEVAASNAVIFKIFYCVSSMIDETTIKCAEDTGPVCGCDEKYDLIKNYKPFVIGGISPYDRKKITENESLQVYWKRLKLGFRDLIFEKPTAVHESEIPENGTLPREIVNDDTMFVRQPKYTEGYLKEKLKQCPREHTDGCNCRSQ